MYYVHFHIYIYIYDVFFFCWGERGGYGIKVEGCTGLGEGFPKGLTVGLGF